MANGAERQRLCATHDVSAADRAELARLESGFRQQFSYDESAATTVIKVQFVHFVDGSNGSLDAGSRRSQIDMLNLAYRPHNLAFEYDEDWLGSEHRLALDPELDLYAGRQFPPRCPRPPPNRSAAIQAGSRGPIPR